MLGPAEQQSNCSQQYIWWTDPMTRKASRIDRTHIHPSALLLFWRGSYLVCLGSRKGSLRTPTTRISILLFGRARARGHFCHAENVFSRPPSDPTYSQQRRAGAGGGGRGGIVDMVYPSPTRSTAGANSLHQPCRVATRSGQFYPLLV